MEKITLVHLYNHLIIRRYPKKIQNKWKIAHFTKFLVEIHWLFDWAKTKRLRLSKILYIDFIGLSKLG